MLCPGVSEAWIVQERFIGKGVQESQEICALVGRQRKSSNNAALVGILVANSTERTFPNCPSARRIVIEDSV